MDHSKENKKTSNSFKPIENIPFIGCFQIFPILFFLLMFIFITVMSFTDKEMLEELSNFDTRTIALYIFILLTTTGIIFGFISSLLFFFSMKNKKLKTLNKGILFNILAWIFSAFSIIIFIIFLSFIR